MVWRSIEHHKIKNYLVQFNLNSSIINYHTPNSFLLQKIGIKAPIFHTIYVPMLYAITDVVKSVWRMAASAVELRDKCGRTATARRDRAVSPDVLWRVLDG